MSRTAWSTSESAFGRALVRAVTVIPWLRALTLLAAGGLAGAVESLEAQASGSADPDSAIVLPGITVTSGRSGVGYVEGSADVGLGFPAELRRVPQSVHVMSNRMLREQLPVTLSDIVRNTGGVSAARSSAETFRSFKLRGFDIGEAVVDGMRNTGSLNIQAEGMANIDRVEILRGPGAAVFGLGSPGGVINVVTKKPERIARQEFSLRAGSPGYLQPQVDLTGPVGSTERLRYRLIGSYQQRESHIDFVEPQGWQVAPSLEFDLTEHATVRYQLDHRESEMLRYISHPFQGTVTSTGPLRHPRSLFTGEPGQGLTVSQGTQHTVVLERGAESEGRDRLFLRLTSNAYDQPSVAPVAVQEDGRTLTRRFNHFIESEDEAVVGGQTYRRVTLGESVHTVSAGFDLSRWTYDSEFLRGSVTSLDLGNPVYGAEPTGIFQLAHSRDRFTQAGVHVQNAMAFHPDVVLLVGGRLDRLTVRTESLEEGGEGAERTTTQFSPRVGASWEINPGVIPFASYSRSFLAGPAFGGIRSRDAKPFPPQEGTQWEAGLRFDVTNQFLVTVAAYQLERSNVPTADPTDPAFSVLTGLQRSRGVELLGNWEPSERLSVFGSYAYTDARVVEDTNLAANTRIDNVPYHSGRFWGRWAFLSEADRSAGLNLGATYSSSVLAALGNDPVVPGFTVLDGGLFARWNQFEAQLTVTNLTDDFYFLRGAFGGSGVIPGDGRRIISAITWTR